MKKMKRKTVALLMALLLVVSFLPVMQSEATQINNEDPNPGNPNPPAGNRQISLILEGNAFDGADTDFYSYMKTQDSTFEIYVDLDPNGTPYVQTLRSLIEAGKASLAPESQMTYRFDASVSNAKVYIMYASDSYTVSTPGTEATGDAGETVITLSQGQEPHIQIDKKSETLTVTWAYDSASFGEDAYLEHGTAQVTAIEGVQDLSAQFGGNPGDERGGNIAVPSGRKVTIKLIPDYGYQVAGLQLNGGVTLQPDDANMSTFTFVMGDSPVHLKGIFTKAEDRVQSESKQIENVRIDNGSNAVPSGNLRLTVSDAASYDTTDAEKLVEGAQSAQAIDLQLEHIVSKGNGSNWENSVTEFEKPITLSLSLDAYDSNYDYTVVRNHNGTLQALDTTVKDGTIAFETNQFSTYVIVKKEKTTAGGTTTEAPPAKVTTTETPATNTANTVSSPKTGDEAMPIACMLLCVISTSLYVLMEKRK